MTGHELPGIHVLNVPAFKPFDHSIQNPSPSTNPVNISTYYYQINRYIMICDICFIDKLSGVEARPLFFSCPELQPFTLVILRYITPAGIVCAIREIRQITRWFNAVIFGIGTGLEYE